MCYVSDDQGKTWRRNQSILKGEGPDRARITLQEPGVIELLDGRLMMWSRTDDGSQYLSWSKDQGETWSEPQPSQIQSPRSPASMERIPGRQELLMVWNNHANITDSLKNRRTPFHVAISKDEGKSWSTRLVLEDDSNGWYCYTAIEFVGDRVLLGHCAGDRRTGGLNSIQMSSFSIDQLDVSLPEADE